jgi:CheY-like chemotaxis protein
LFDETSLFLHRVIADLPDNKKELIERLHGSTEALRGRKVLVVDDDARNIFALTTILENHEMDVLSATNGRQAIELIKATPDLSVVLMDIMMPEMDGFETMREIRKDPELRTLPILALTAKAMKGDREKCLEAGASDYIAKPVDTDQLLSLLRVWLHR